MRAVGWEHDRRRALEIEELATDGYGPHAETLGLVGRSRAVIELGHRIAALAPSPATVFVHGETGTGKELIARALHSESPRSERPFLPHNFASIPEVKSADPLWHVSSRESALAANTARGPIHMPNNSYWPLVSGVGVALLLSGMVFGWAAGIPGLVLMLVGLFSWSFEPAG